MSRAIQEHTHVSGAIHTLSISLIYALSFSRARCRVRAGRVGRHVPSGGPCVLRLDGVSAALGGLEGDGLDLAVVVRYDLHFLMRPFS
jgi:hypothetical protein